MTSVSHEIRGSRPDEHVSSSYWTVSALVLALTAVAGWRDGGFWPAEAAAIAVIAGVLLVAALVLAPPDGRSLVTILGLGLLVLWWWIRTVTAGAATDFLPFGASIICFAAAFAAVRALRGLDREVAGLAMACLGAVAALAGFVGLTWRVFPLAMPAQGLWRLSSTLTYADAAGLVLGLCLLLALGCDRHPVLVRVAICLNVAGLLATQSRGALVAVACASLLVPARRYTRFVPLLAGAGLGIVAIASSTGNQQEPWLGAAALGAVVIAAWDPRPLRALPSWTHTRVSVIAAVLGVITGVGLVLRHEIGLRFLAPSDGDRSVEWSTALHQWASSPFLGVGADRPLLFHAGDGTFAHFVHDEYLQIGADSGLVGFGLLGLVTLSASKVLHRADPLSSCAVAALVCLAVGGLFDFDWHLPVVGLVGGWCLGLAPGRDLEQ